jgi:hypothetical protein
VFILLNISARPVHCRFLCILTIALQYIKNFHHGEVSNPGSSALEANPMTTGHVRNCLYIMSSCHLQKVCKAASQNSRFECNQGDQRPILNFAPRGKLWPTGTKLSHRDELCPLGAKVSPRGEFCPLGVNLSPGGEILCLPLHSSKQLRVFTPGGEQRGEHFP